MKHLSVALLVLSLALSCTQSSETVTETKDTDRIKVYLLGSFHFAQMDSTYNVLDDEHQKSILRLCQTIINQNPDKVFVERQPEYEFQNKYDSLFTVYLNNEKLIAKAKNEMFQVGFRVAKQLNHPKVYQCDNPGMYGYNYSKALKYAKANDQMDYLEGTAKGTVQREDDRIDEDSLRNSTTLFDYIKWINSDAVMDTSHASYIANDTQVGSKDYYNYDDDDTLIGAEIVAGWYRRNIMIYTKMINQLNYDESAIFLIIGADHVPTLKHLFESNPYFEVVDPKVWLQ